MICPYNQSVGYEEQKNILNEDNQEYIGTVITKKVWTNMQCQKENCAVWIRGRCRYNG